MDRTELLRMARLASKAALLAAIAANAHEDARDGAGKPSWTEWLVDENRRAARENIRLALKWLARAREMQA